MPAQKDFLTLFFDELNRINGQTFPASNFLLGSPVAGASGNQTAINMKATVAANIPGKITVNYQRINLSEVFALAGNTFAVQRGNSVATLLPELYNVMGFNMDPSDIVDAPVTFVNGQASVTITAQPTSKRLKGSVTLTVLLQPLALITALPVTTLVPGVTKVDFPTLFNQIIIQNKRLISMNDFTFDGPFDTQAAGLPTAQNTAFKMTAIPGRGYTGAIYFYYNRQSIGSILNGHSSLDVSSPVTARDLVPFLNQQVSNVFIPNDLVDNALDFSTLPSINRLTADPSSWSFNLTGSIDIRRRSDYTQKITINYTTDDLAYTSDKLSQSVLAQWDGVTPFVDITLNVGKNVTLIGATEVNPTLLLKNYGGITQSNYILNNQGSIYGRGGRALGGNTAGTAGGDAVNIATTNVLLSVNNSGRIAGGGGGGGSQNVSGNVGAGGQGAPLGGQTGFAATLTNPTNGTVASTYPIQVTGGNGGGVGVPGGPAIFILVSNGATTNYANGGAAGAAIGGQVGNATYVNRGVLLPLAAQDIIGPAPAASSALIATFLDPNDSSKSAGYFGLLTIAQMMAGNTLSTAVDLMPQGRLGNLVFTQGIGAQWMKFYLDGKTLFIPQQAYGSASFPVSWNDLYSAGLVYGTNDNGVTPGATPVNQMKLVAIKGQVFKSRLMRGANTDPMTTTSAVDASEWNRLMYYVSSSANATPRLGYPWAAMADVTLGLSANMGANHMQERGITTSSPIARLQRGYDGSAFGIDKISPLNAETVAVPSGSWRPVLEFVRTVNTSEYTRFVAWLATQSFYSANTETNSTTANMIANIGKLVSKQMVAGGGNLWGSPWGTNFTYDSALLLVMQHAYPTGAHYQDNIDNTRISLFMETDAGQLPNFAISRNGLTSTAYTTFTSRRLTRFIYFDFLTEKMMEVNPSTTSAPVPFVF